MFRRSVTELKQQLSTVTNESAGVNDSVDESGVQPAMLVWDKVRLVHFSLLMMMRIVIGLHLGVVIID